MTGPTSQRPVIAIVTGDVAGIGPEVALRTLSRPETYQLCRPLVIGDVPVLAENARLLGLPVRIVSIARAEAAVSAYGTVEVLTPDRWEGFPRIPWAEVDDSAGRFCAQSLELACDLAAAGLIGGVIWAPINKQAFHLAGYPFRDEMEFLADRTQSSGARLFGVVGELWVTPATLHVPLRDVADLITCERLLGAIEAIDLVLRQVGVTEPSIAVAALNPHAGDGGLLGREEIEQIAPAVAAARGRGVRAHGPYPADTVFLRARAEQAHGIVCMYHDQANIARKLHPFRDAATVITGLPVPCATTAHGPSRRTGLSACITTRRTSPASSTRSATQPR
jgi:4-hydroxythreonine-4-phosphate dehydrogenase